MASRKIAIRLQFCQSCGNLMSQIGRRCELARIDWRQGDSNASLPACKAGVLDLQVHSVALGVIGKRSFPHYLRSPEIIRRSRWLNMRFHEQ